MRLFPALTEEFISPLPPAEMLRRVQNSVQQTKAFTGSVAVNEFTINRVIDYRNSMLPRINGQVTAGSAGGSRLRLQHSLHPFLLAFAALWLGGVGSVVLTMSLAWAQGGFRIGAKGLTGPDLIPVGMLGLGLLLFTVPFWLEVRQSRPLLIELLQLESVKEEAGG